MSCIELGTHVSAKKNLCVVGADCHDDDHGIGSRVQVVVQRFAVMVILGVAYVIRGEQLTRLDRASSMLNCFSNGE